MRALSGLTIAFAFFAGSFALHIVGGATDQGWLFAIAVFLIYLAATGFPAIALIVAGLGAGNDPQARVATMLGAVAGIGFTLGALWATNGRAFAWWEFPLAPLLVGVVSAVPLLVYRRGGWRPRPRPSARAGAR